MATTYHFADGTIMWAKGLATVDPKFETYNASLEVSKEVADRLKAAGCAAEFHPVEDRFSFKIKKSATRIQIDKVTKAKSIVPAGPPRVFLTDPNGQDVDLDPKTVGNGSEVTVKLEMYDTSKGGKGTRLMAVRVNNLIEFVPNEENTADMPF